MPLQPGPASTPASVVAGGPTPQRSVVLRGGMWNALAQLAPIVVNIGLTPYVIAGLGVRAFGLFVLMVTVAEFIGSFDSGVYRAAQRYFAINHGTGDREASNRILRTAALCLLALGGLLAGVLVLAAPGAVRLLNVPDDLAAEGQFLLRALGLVVALALVRGLLVAHLNAHQRFALTSLVTIGQYGVYTAGVIVAISGGYGLRGVAVTLVVQTAATVVAVAVPVLLLARPWSTALMSRQELRELLGFTGSTQVASLSDLAALQSQSLLIGSFLGVGQLGLYSPGANFANQLRRLPLNLLSPALSVLGRTYGRHGPAAAADQFAAVQRAWVQGVTAVLATAAAAAYWGVTAWLGQRFELAGKAAVALLVAYLIRSLTGALAVYCRILGRADLEARYGIVAMVATVGGAGATIVPFGVAGVVGSTIAAQALASAYLLRLCRSQLPTPPPSPYRNIPWLATAVSVPVVVVLELLVQPWLPEGPLGLLGAGLAAAPGLMVFAIVLLGPSGSLHRARLLARRVRPGTAASSGAT